MSVASEARCSPRPCAISCERFSKLISANIVTLCSAQTLPSLEHPDVPELIPKVWLPNVPLVVAMKITPIDYDTYFGTSLFCFCGRLTNLLLCFYRLLQCSRWLGRRIAFDRNYSVAGVIDNQRILLVSHHGFYDGAGYFPQTKSGEINIQIHHCPMTIRRVHQLEAVGILFLSFPKLLRTHRITKLDLDLLAT